MRILLFAVVLFCGGFAGAQVPGVYDNESAFLNPLEQPVEGCNACVDFYRVNRPVAPFVYHVFIGAQTQWSCTAPQLTPPTQLSIYGGIKGASDLKHFKNFISRADQASSQARLRFIGRACDEQARSAFAAAVETSQARRDYWNQNPISGVGRMVATPLMGRPCAETAQMVIDAILPFVSAAP